MTVPDQKGRVTLITGGNSGIGRETAVALAAAGATTVITSRNRAKGEEALADIAARAGSGEVHLVDLDLASFASIRAAAAEVLARWDRLDVLVNNAGGILTEQSVTEEGFESTLGGNHIGPFLLTELLLERLRASAPARVVTLSSIAHRGARSPLAESDMFPSVDYTAMRAYTKSKLANVQFARELARRERERGSGITSFAVHPGGVRSGFGTDGDTRGVLGVLLKAARPLSISSATGAAASVHAATAPGIEPKSGAYFQRAVGGNFGPVAEMRPTALARDERAGRDLWAITENLIASAG